HSCRRQNLSRWSRILEEKGRGGEVKAVKMTRARASLCIACLCAAVLGCTPATAAEAFITDQAGDEVSVLDLGSKDIVARIPVSGKPAGVAIAPDGHAAYVTSTEGKYVSVIDT